MRFVWDEEHARAGQSHAGTDARGEDAVELHKADEPWAALMIPHNGGDTQRDTWADTAKHTRGAKRTMSAYTPCALRFYTPVLRLTAVTLTHVWGDETLTRGGEGRERPSASALQQIDGYMSEVFPLAVIVFPRVPPIFLRSLDPKSNICRARFFLLWGFRDLPRLAVTAVTK